jgi:hypothetical protein
VVEADPTMLYEGRHKYTVALRQWSKAVKEDVYPGWGNKIDLIGLKPWDQVAEREWEEDE